MNLIPLFTSISPPEIVQAFNELIEEINVLFSAIVSNSSNFIGYFAVSALPASPTQGAMAYATNGRKVSETTGNGTGVLVYFSAGSWRDMSTDANVSS